MRWGKIGWWVCAAWLSSLALAGGAAAQSDDQTPWLGVTTQDITSDLREGLNYKGDGVIVNRVVADSPAAKAGVKKGDVIVTFKSKPIDSPGTLMDAVRDAKIGESVAVGVIRSGTRRTLTARLVAMPEDMADDYDDFPEPPEAPRAPRAPRMHSWSWNGDDFNWNGDVDGLMALNSRGRLGVTVQELNPSLGDALGVPDGKGVLVIDVIDDTPAKKAGIKGGDVIVKVGDSTIDETGDIRRALRDKEGNVPVVLMRKGVRRTVQANIEREKTPSSGVYRFGPGGRSRTYVRIPDSHHDSDLDEEMQQLREELRDLRKKLETMDKK